jgi:hypothetical protein
LVAAPSVTKSYTGRAMNNVIPVLTYNGKKLTNKKDFTVAYNDKTDGAYKNASNTGYDITVTGTGNYTGTKDVKLYVVNTTNTKMVDINKTKITQQNKSFFLSTPSYVYNGKAIEPEVVVTYNDPKTGAQRTLEKGVDYKVTYANNTNVGTASIIVEGTGEVMETVTTDDGVETKGTGEGFYGSKTLTFKITPANLKDVVLSSSQYAKAASTTTTYKGQAIVFSDLELLLKSNDGTNDVETVLEEDKDYTITYTNNSKAGNASFTIKGKGNCTGTLKKTFKIEAYNIELDEEGIVGGSIKDTSVVEVAYAAGGAKPAVSVTLGGIVLKAGTDYTVTYSGNTKVNSNATVTVTGRNGLTGKISKSFVVTKKDMADVELPLTMTAADVVVKKSSSAPKTTVKITDYLGKTVSAGEYTLSYYDEEGNEITGKKTFKPEAGDKITVRATAKPTSKNYVGSIETTYKVSTVDVKSTTLKAFDWKYYTGSAQSMSEEDFEYTDPKTGELTSRITYKGQSLWFGTDFEVVPGSYENNVKAGTARFTIRGISAKYGGTKILTFRINKKILNVAKAVYTWDTTNGALVVTLNNLQLTEGVDYTIDDTLFATKGTVVVNGKGSYGGTKTVSVSKNLTDISKATVVRTAEVTDAITADNVANYIKVTVGSTELVLGTDYTVDATTYAEDGKIKITGMGSTFGKGNYKGSVTKEFKSLTRYIASAADVTVQKQNGAAESAKIADILIVKVGDNTLTKGTDYTATANTEGTQVTITFKGKYTGEITVKVADIKEAPAAATPTV